VPQLLEEYRVRREAWVAQADELSRLRDEVKTSAEREAMEIVTAARRDIRQIVMEARRELFVLSAQVQAALGAAAAAHHAQIPARDEHAAADDLSNFVEEEWSVAPRSSVKIVLEQAREEMTHLAEDAREVAVHMRETVGWRAPEPLAAPAVTRQTEATAIPRVSKSTSKALLSAPFQMFGAGVAAKTAASDRWSLRSPRVLVAASVVAAVTVALGAIWLADRPEAGPSSAARLEAAGAAAPAPAALAPSSAAAAPAPAATAPLSGVKISLETIRPAWIRAIVDNRPDAGQTLEAGRVYEFAGSRSIALRIGDAGAVRVSVNGGAPRALGRDGQVVNRLFAIERAGQVIADAAPPASRSAEETEALPAAAAIPPSVAPVLAEGPAPALPPPPPAASESSATAGTNGVGAASAVPATQSMLTAAAQQWLDAYHRQDRTALAALSAQNVMVNDERPTNERMPPAAGEIARTLDRVSVQAAADTAVLTAVMTERVVGGGLQRSSPVSLVWVQADGAWRLAQARLVSESRLSQIFR
jgi:hypothetical protein